MRTFRLRQGSGSSSPEFFGMLLFEIEGAEQLYGRDRLSSFPGSLEHLCERLFERLIRGD